MEVKRVVTGYLDENCYLLIQNGTCLVVDPGDEFHKIKEEIGENKVLGVLITHSHFDHIGALRNFLTKKSIKIFKRSNLVENKEYQLGDFTFECLYTPGHSKDSVSFYFKNENFMFVGDFIFNGGVGRVDLPGGSSIELEESISKMMSYPDDMVLYPGHHDSTILGNEKENNPFFP